MPCRDILRLNRVLRSLGEHGLHDPLTKLLTDNTNAETFAGSPITTGKSTRWLDIIYYFVPAVNQRLFGYASRGEFYSKHHPRYYRQLVVTPQSFYNPSPLAIKPFSPNEK